MNIFTAIRNNILDSLDELVKDGKLPATIDPSRMVAEPPRVVFAGYVIARFLQQRSQSVAGQHAPVQNVLGRMFERNP